MRTDSNFESISLLIKATDNLGIANMEKYYYRPKAKNIFVKLIMTSFK